MSFPVIVYGKFGMEKNTYATRPNNMPLGQRMMLPDGKMFALAHCSSTAALNIGELCVQKALAHTAQVVSWTGSAAVGATTIYITTSATGAVTTDQYRDGDLWCFDDNGQGFRYKIKSNNSAAVSSTTTFTLYPYDPVKVLLKAASSKIGVRESPFADVLARATGTASVGVPAGLPANTVAADYYFWIQRRGEAGALVAGTVGLVGEPAVAATTVAGGFQRWLVSDTTIVPAGFEIGKWMYTPAQSTDYGLIYLTLD